MRKIFLSLCLALICSTQLFAYDCEIDGIYYDLDDEQLTASVTIGDNYYSGVVRIPSSIIYNQKTYSVTSIGSSAFCGCTSLTSITIPSSVTSIGYDAFYGCSGLTSVTIPNSVTTIRDRAFWYCDNLTSIYNASNLFITKGSTYHGRVGYNADTVYNHVSCESDFVIMDDTILVLYLGNDANVTIPENITSILGYAFSGCRGLTSVTIPNSVTSIGGEAFAYCSGLTSVTIGNSVTTIGYGAFYGCGLTSVTIPNSVTTIGGEAFAYCSGLTSVTIGNSVTTIGELAFCYCTGLIDIYCYATTPPYIETNQYAVTPFTNVSEHCYVHVPVGTKRAYELAVGWSHFIHFFEMSEISGETSDEVGIEVSGNTAIFTWPVNPTASSYTLVIKKNDEVFCTLTFNSLGQLVGMAFAPARNRNQQSSAESTTYGYSFVVSNLDASSTYDYTFTAKDNKGQILSTQSGSFTTKGETDLLSLPYKGKEGTGTKFIQNGQLYILRDGIMYDARGVRIE